MSQENVEIVRRIVDAWNRRDEEELLALSDPEVEFVNSPTAVEPGTRRGLDEIRAVFQMRWEILRDGRAEIDRIYDRGEEIVDAWIEDRSLVSWTIRDGKIIRSEVLGFGRAEVEKALQAAGLKE
jgi:ketosteroid isomerase-like protein